MTLAAQHREASLWTTPRGRLVVVRLRVLFSHLIYECTCPKFTLIGQTLLGESAGVHICIPSYWYLGHGRDLKSPVWGGFRWAAILVFCPSGHSLHPFNKECSFTKSTSSSGFSFSAASTSLLCNTIFLCYLFTLLFSIKWCYVFKKIRAEINKIVLKNTKNQWIQSWFFENINKTGKFNQTHQEKRNSLGSPGLNRTYQGLDCVIWVTKNCNWNVALAACHNESQTHEAGGGAKGKRFIHVSWPRRMEDSCLIEHPPSCSSKDKKGRAVFSLIILLSFGTLQPCLSSVWCAWVLSIYFSSFWYTQCKNLPLCHFGQWGKLPSSPTDYLQLQQHTQKTLHDPNQGGNTHCGATRNPKGAETGKRMRCWVQLSRKPVSRPRLGELRGAQQGQKWDHQQEPPPTKRREGTGSGNCQGGWDFQERDCILNWK